VGHTAGAREAQSSKLNATVERDSGNTNCLGKDAVL
jgi:hypothetical protein